MKPFRFYVFVFFIGALMVPNMGNSMDLFFAPKRIAVSDKNPITELRVSNQSNITRSYSVSMSDIIMTEKGVTARVDGFDYSARRLVRFVPRQFDLEPGKQQIVRVMARLPADKPDGEYHSHLEFLEDVSKRDELNPTDDPEKRAQASAEVSFSTAIPVTVSKGEIDTQVGMQDLSFRRDEDGRTGIDMVLSRSGNGQGNSLFEVDYISPAGDVISTGRRRHVYTYRELDSRAYYLGFQLADGVQIEKGGMLKVRLFNKNIPEAEPVQEETLTIN